MQIRVRINPYAALARKYLRGKYHVWQSALARKYLRGWYMFISCKFWLPLEQL